MTTDTRPMTVGSKHTPGPWREEHNAQGGFTIWSERGPIAASMVYESEQYKRQANARLIAAAPIGHKLATQVMAWANACPSPIVQLASEFLQQAEGQ